MSALALALAACTRPPDESPGSDPDSAVTATTAETGAPPTTTDTGEPVANGLYPAVPYDCSAGVPSGPFTPIPVTGVRTTEDFAISPAGDLYASDLNENLLRYTSDGVGEVFVPSYADTRGLDILPDGGLVLSNETVAQLTRVDLTSGASTSLAPIGTSPSALDVASDGAVYVGDLATGGVYEVLPEGTVTDLGPVTAELAQTYGIALSLDERTLYVSRYNGTTVYRLQRGDDGRWGGAEAWVDLPDFSPTGMVVDACDNVYVVTSSRCNVFRISPDAEIEKIAAGIPGAYCANLAFGRDVGGWDPLSLYVSTYDELARLEVGVPGRPR